MPRPKGARDSDYEQKRSALLQKVTARLMQPDETRPSLRQLAFAAEVTVPTLRHYFGTREALVQAVLSEFHRLALPHMQAGAEPVGSFPDSIRAYAAKLSRAMVSGPQISRIFAVGYIEGLLNRTLGPAFLTSLMEPTLVGLESRLKAHQVRGEMIGADTRTAALLLVAPLLIACHHQDEFYGRDVWPLDLESFVDELVAAFVRAYGTPAAAPRRLDS